MSNLEKLYYNMENLSDDWTDTPETMRAYEKLEEKIDKSVLRECESEIFTHATACEKQGFIRGFQYAVSLLTSGKTEVTA